MLEKRDDGCSNSLTTVQKDNLVFNTQPRIPNKPLISGDTNKTGNNQAVYQEKVKILRERPRYENGKRKCKIYEYNIIPTLSVNCAMGDQKNVISGTITQAFGRSGCSKEELRSAELNLNVTGNLRRLTPKECFRLMGFLNDEINLDGISDTQKYKLAGNGWDINLVSKLFKEMFKQESLSQTKLQEGRVS
jgi:site-specific DNA-cytosine methylase